MASVEVSQLLEAGALFAGLLLTGQLAFGGLLPATATGYPLEFLCTPFLGWVVFRFGQREASLAILVLSVQAMWGTLRGYGSFVRETPNESLLLLQAYMAVASLTTLTIAAIVADRAAAEARLRELSVSDPLTGIGQLPGTDEPTPERN